MYRVLIPFSLSHLSMTLAMNSGPLSERMHSGVPGALVYQIERPQLVPSLGVVRDEGPEVVAPDSLLR